MISWKKNLTIIWLSQFLSIAGFSFSVPFAPYFMQELGITDPHLLKIYVSIFSSANFLTLAIFAPIWGTLADKYGRRIMLLRANFGGAILLALMGTSTSVTHLIILRMFQGILTGTIVAAQTLVSVHTPNNRSGMALGTLSAAVFSGMMFGSFFGGWFADYFGYRNAFYCSGFLLLLAGILVLFGAKDHFIKPEKKEAIEENRTSRKPSIRKQIGPALPILFLLLLMAFVRQFGYAFLPLLVQDIQGTLKGAATKTGTLNAISGIAGILAGIIIGRMADWISPPKIGKFSALMAGLFMAPIGLAQGFILLFAARFGMVFFAGGLDPVFQIWLAKVTPEKKRGFIFGWSATAKATGWMLAPLTAGLVASIMNIRAIYICGAGLYLLLIPMIGFVVKRLGKERS